jgi:hypothetical protein
MMRKSYIILLFAVIIVASSFVPKETLKGAWEYAGGIYNGKKEGPPVDYKLQRKYDKQHYEAYAIDSASTPEKYEAGDYILKGDTCTETETYSKGPSKLTGIPVHYLYSIRNDTLTLKATLPSGMIIEEYWRRMK